MYLCLKNHTFSPSPVITAPWETATHRQLQSPVHPVFTSSPWLQMSSLSNVFSLQEKPHAKPIDTSAAEASYPRSLAGFCSSLRTPREVRLVKNYANQMSSSISSMYICMYTKHRVKISNHSCISVAYPKPRKFLHWPYFVESFHIFLFEFLSTKQVHLISLVRLAQNVLVGCFFVCVFVRFFCCVFFGDYFFLFGWFGFGGFFWLVGCLLFSVGLH